MTTIKIDAVGGRSWEKRTLADEEAATSRGIQTRSAGGNLGSGLASSLC